MSLGHVSLKQDIDVFVDIRVSKDSDLDGVGIDGRYFSCEKGESKR